MSRPRAFLLGAALLVLLLALTPLIPRGDDGDGLRPSGRQESWALADAPGAGKVTPAMRAEIDRVVDDARAVGRGSGKQSPEALVDDLVRCADLEGQTYCLGVGWTDRTEAQVQARMRVAAQSAPMRSRAPRAPWPGRRTQAAVARDAASPTTGATR